MPIISIITVCLDAIDSLKITAQSISAQNYSKFEWIVIDGGSIDGTVEYLESLDITTHLISEKDSGIYDAMNKGIKLAKGRYCLFLNAGDRLFDNSVLRSIAPYLKADLVVGQLSVVNHPRKEDFIQCLDFRSLAKHAIFFTSLLHPSTFIKRRLFDKFGGYDETFMIAGDHDFFARVLRKNVSVEFAPITVAVFPMGGVSGQMKHSQLFSDELAKVQKENFALIDRIWITLFISFKKIVRKILRREKSKVKNTT